MFMDYLKEAFTTQDGIVKLIMGFALFVVLVPKYGLAGLNLGAAGMEPDLTSVMVHGVVFAALMALLCAGYMWAKEKYMNGNGNGVEVVEETFY
jgi:hypothetical protein